MSKTTAKDFIRPEDERPEKGPVYAINTTPSRIVFAKRDNIAGVNFGPKNTPDSVRQIDIRMLDVVEFLKLWANGSIAVSTSSKVATTYTSLELDRKSAADKEKNDIIESITNRDTSSDYEVDTSKDGTPEVKKVDKTEDKTEDTSQDKTEEKPKATTTKNTRKTADK